MDHEDEIVVIVLLLNSSIHLKVKYYVMLKSINL